MLPRFVVAGLLGSACAHVLDRRQLSPASVVQSDALPAPLESNNTVASDVESSLDSDTGSYYLGYREEDFKKPYAK